MIRLALFLAHAGIASRRRAEELIGAGRVQVNGVPVTTQGVRIDPERDEVLVDGKKVHLALNHVYVMLHKPVGYVSTAYDPQGRPTVLDLLPAELRRLRVYPVGRLDIDTSGLLLLTNDGDFALRMMHPRYALEKRYHALVQGCPSAAGLAALQNGVTISEDNGRTHRTAPARVRVLRGTNPSRQRRSIAAEPRQLANDAARLPSGSGKLQGVRASHSGGMQGEKTGADCWLELIISEGRKRQVRRMLAAVGHPVIELVRVGIGSLTLGDLAVGKWRYVTESELT